MREILRGLFRDGDFRLFQNNDRFVLTFLGDNGERLTDVFFNGTNQLTQGDVELSLNGEVVGLVRQNNVSGRLIQALQEV